jgi:hypothetical protein
LLAVSQVCTATPEKSTKTFVQNQTYSFTPGPNQNNSCKTPPKASLTYKHDHESGTRTLLPVQKSAYKYIGAEATVTKNGLTAFSDSFLAADFKNPIHTLVITKVIKSRLTNSATGAYWFYPTNSPTPCTGTVTWTATKA